MKGTSQQPQVSSFWRCGRIAVPYLSCNQYTSCILSSFGRTPVFRQQPVNLLIAHGALGCLCPLPAQKLDPSLGLGHQFLICFVMRTPASDTQVRRQVLCICAGTDFLPCLPAESTHESAKTSHTTSALTKTPCCGVGSRRPASCGIDTTPRHLAPPSIAPLQTMPSYNHRVLSNPSAFRGYSHSTTAAGRCELCHTRCQASKPSTDAPVSIDASPEVGKGKKLLIIGGTGRVGSSTAASLVQTHPNLTIILGTRGQEGYDAAVKNRPSLKGLEYRIVDRNDLQSILSAIQGCDIVLHTAGPFQRKKECLVLEAAIQAKIPYLGKLPVLQSMKGSPTQCASLKLTTLPGFCQDTAALLTVSNCNAYLSSGSWLL